MLHDHTIEEVKRHMEVTLKVFEDELKKLSTGRANPAMVEDIHADYYGTKTPIKHMASITSPDASSIVIRPFDKSQVAAIEKAIQEANLGFNPLKAEDMLRIVVPKLSEERRKDLAKIIHHKAEETRVAMRNVRRHLKEELEKRKSDHVLAEDDFHRQIKELDAVTHQYTERVDKLVLDKEKQITTV